MEHTRLNAGALAVARDMATGGRGLLAMDESTSTCNKRFDAAGIPQTEDARRAWRELLVTTPQLAECIGGAILYDETIRQSGSTGARFVDTLINAGIIAGIKVDTGAQDLAGRPGEKVTEGLDGLRVRLAEYAGMGARFAKWRAVLVLGDRLPSTGCIEANAVALARYAALCQEAEIVPIVEPELLMDGTHSLERCADVTEAVMRSVFQALDRQGVMLEGIILKPSMVLQGLDCSSQQEVNATADATLRCLSRVVPAAVPAIMFLSGGQSGASACARLNAMNVRFAWPAARLPWTLSFSFGRAIQHPALELWHGESDNKALAQRALLHRARCSRAASLGQYTASMETV